MNLFDQKKLPFKKLFVLSLLPPLIYNLTNYFPLFVGVVPLFFFSLLLLTKSHSSRITFYLTLFSAFLTYSWHINFLYNLFETSAFFLWAIMALWMAFFILIAKFILEKFPKKIALILLPLIYFCLEYTHSELYPLRFNWTTLGYLFHHKPYNYGIQWFGIYGISTLILLVLLLTQCYKPKISLPIFCLTLSMIGTFSLSTDYTKNIAPRITGIQLEFPDLKEALAGLDKALAAQPNSQIFMLSEYSFSDGIPQEVLAWCKNNNKYLIAGTMMKLPEKKVYNTAVVVNPQGIIEFTQAKAQPIQFFNDGLPAESQNIWNSPWGKIGLCICYDLSYTRVTDRLVSLGAQILIVPTMDVEGWGQKEHDLHARVAPLRAAEYGIPIFKVASSGYSQAVDNNGKIYASASYPGQGEIITATLNLKNPGRKPLDRLLFFPALLIIFSLTSFHLLKSKSSKI